MIKRLQLFLALIGLVTGPVLWAQHDHGHDGHSHDDHESHAEEGLIEELEEEAGFDPSPFIMHHVADAYDIHLWGEGESAVHIPLPVILYSEGHGLHVFMSSAFHGHGDERHAVMEDGTEYVLSHGHISLAGDHSAHDHGGEHITDLSITKSVFGMLFIMALLVFLFGRAAASYKKRPGQAPTGLTNVLEPLVVFVRDDIAVPSLGEKKAQKFLPFLLTVFFFILFANLLGLIPFIGGFNITGTVGITMVMATFVFLLTSLNGNKHYWGHLFWPPGVPIFVMPIIIPIEIVGMFLKPIVLMIRLTANITAGHIIILSFVSLILIFGESSAVAGYGVGIFSTLFMIFMYCIELLVAFLQAFIFTLLAAIYFGEATHEAHH